MAFCVLIVDTKKLTLNLFENSLTLTSIQTNKQWKSLCTLDRLIHIAGTANAVTITYCEFF